MRIDITHERCPMTYVRVKLALEALRETELLEVLLEGEEPVRNVPASAIDDGYEVVSMVPLEGGVHLLTIKPAKGF
jgi:tRNA 2-thiouridine synthesizing protein A